MAKIKINDSLSRKVHLTGLKVRKHSPEILVVGGVVGMVASTVMACKATTKAGDILNAKNEEMSKIAEVKAKVENGEIGEEEYSDKDLKKDTTLVYAKTCMRFAKLYAPAVILGVTSISSILYGHNILRKRNVALAAAYKVIDTGYKEYRSRVIERFGENLDKELKYGISSEEVEEIEVDKKGKEKVVKKDVKVMDYSAMHSPYAKFFDEGCNGWMKDPEASKLFLLKQQQQANDMLRARGYLFLNEVYQMLGIPRTKDGQIMGWIYDEEHPVGDNFIDFGIFDADKENCRDFVNGYERNILLDFNIDGNILELL